jgi:tetratricopeptide (TPR) repeat protein
MLENHLLPKKILVVDSDPMVGNLCQRYLRRYDISVLTAYDLSTALYRFNQNRLDVVLIDINFRELPGLAVIQKWRSHDFFEKRHTGFVVLTGPSRQSGQEKLASELGDIEVSTKPIPEPQLIPLLSRALVAKQKLALLHSIKDQFIFPHLRSGEADKAIAMARTLIEKYGNSAKKILLEVFEYNSNWDQCLSFSLEMLKDDPADPFLLNMAGKMHFKTGEFELARKYMEQADTLAPQNIDRVSTLAKVYLKTKDPQKSAKKYKELLDLCPENPNLRFDAMKNILDAGFAGSAAEFGSEFGRPEEVIKYYNNRGVALSKAGKTDEAMVEYENAIKFFPQSKQNCLIFYNMALAHLKTNSTQKAVNAISCLRRSLELDPSFEKAKLKLQSLLADNSSSIQTHAV